MSGFLCDLSPSQAEALANFRKEVEDLSDKPLVTDEYYLKWLRARDFNLAASLLMFRNHLEWRRKWDADNIFDWQSPEIFEKYMPGRYFGEDREGHPVFYDFLGNLDVKGIYKSCDSDDGFRYKIYQAELGNRVLEEQSNKYGRRIETIVTVCSMENLSYQRQYHWQGLQLIRKAFTLFAENYPERTKAIFIIRAPKVFPMAFNLVKHLMHENTRKKLHVLGDDYEDVLLQHIAPDQLPAAFGGERMEPDPECTGVLNWGGTVPKEYYLTNQTTTGKENMNKVTVRRGSTHEHDIDIQTHGCVIKWEFITENYDIGFSLVYKSCGSLVRLVKYSRYNSHVQPGAGTHTCNEPGTYTLVFDNSHSWLRSKELYYCVEVGEISSHQGTSELSADEIVDMTGNRGLEEVTDDTCEQ